MGNKKSWRDYINSDDNSEDNEKTGSWRDYIGDNSTGSGSSSGSWRDYTSYDIATTVGSNITDRVNTWIKNHNNYISNYQNRYSGRKYNYEDSYVSDSGSWLDTVSKQKSNFDAEADSILSYMDQYKDYLDADWMNSVRETLTGARDTQGQIIDIVTKDNEWWNSFGSEELVSKYGSAEEAYKANQRYDGYSKKYSGQKYDDIQKALDALEDGEEKEWLTSYASFVEYDEMGKMDLTKAAEEINEMETVLKEVEVILMGYGLSGDETDNNLINQVRNVIGDYSNGEYYRIYDLEEAISKKEQKLNLANRIQKSIKMSGVADQASNYYDPEFSQHTKYVDDGKQALIPDYKDVVYDVINNNADSGSYVVGQAWGRISDSELDRLRAVKHMSKDEVALYNYYYNKHGYDAAEEYLDGIMDNLNALRGAEMFKPMENKLLLELAFGVAAGLDQFASGIKSLFSDKDYIPTSAIQYASGLVREDMKDVDLKWYNIKDGDWEDAKIFGNSLGQGIYDLTTTTANMAPSILVSSLVGMANPAAGAVVGNMLMGASAAGNAYADALNRGFGKDEARVYGTAIGASEALLQRALGGIGKLGGVSSNLTKAVAGIDNALLRFSLQYGGKMASEGLEEGLQEILDPILQNAILYADEDVNWSEVAYSALLGGLSAGILELPGTIGQTKVEQSLKKQYGGNTDALIQEGLESDINSESYRLATQYKANTDSGKTLTGAQIRNLLAANQEQITPKDLNKIQKAAEKRLTDLGQTEDVAKIAELATKRATGQKLTRAEKSFLANSQYGARVANELLPENIMSGDYSTEWAEGIGTKQVNAVAYNKKQITSILEQMASAEDPNAYKSLESRVDTETPAKVSDTGKAVVRATGEEIDLTTPTFKQITEDGVVLEANGKMVRSNEIDYDSEDQGLAINAIGKIEHITPAAASALYAKLDMTKSVMKQLNGMDEAFTYGFYNYPEADLDAGNFTGNLTKDQLKDAYNLGRYVRKNSRDANIETTKRMRTSVEAEAAKQAEATKERIKSNAKEVNVWFEDGDKVVKFDEAGHKYDDKRMAGVKTAQFLQRLGIGGKNVYFYESHKKSDGKFYRTDANGKEIEAENGWIDANGDIHIDINAGADGRGVTLFTLGHELTHFIEVNSKEKYQVLVDMVTEAYAKTDMTMHERVLAKQKFLEAKRGETVSYSEAHSEVMADALSTMLADGNLAERLAEIRTKDKGLFRLIKRFINKVISKFRKAYAELTPDQQDAQDIRQMKEVFDNLQAVFAEALVEASDNFRASENFQASEGQKNTTQEGDVREQARPSAKNPNRLDPRSVTREDVRELLQNAEAGLYAENTYIPVRISTPGIVQERLFAEDLPMAMPVKKVKQEFMPDLGPVVGKNVRGHELTVDELLYIIEMLDSPDYLFSQADGRGVAVLSLPGSPVRKTVIVDFGQNINASYMNGYDGDKYNISITAFDIDGGDVGLFMKQLEKGWNKVFDKQKEGDPAKKFQATRPFAIEQDTLTENVSQPDAEVKSESAVRKSDRQYMDAIDSGDMETVKRMVEEAAKIAGYTIRAYHGTSRADRVGNVFLPERATSGPMAFFTDNRDIAEHYAKDKKDTSLAYDEEYADYYSQFRLNQNGKSIKVQDLWHSLPFSEKQRLKEAGKHITWDEDMENIVWDDDATHGLGNWDAYTLNLHKGNAIEALIECWLESGELWGHESDFLKVLELAGIKGVEYRDPDARHEKVYDTFLKIQKPFNTASVDDAFADGFEKWYGQQLEGKYDRDTSAADMWDKNSQTAETFLERLRDDIENGTSYAWTSIPDSVTDYLKSLGHDGIQDVGGKNGGETHTVWIPFASEQVKSAEPVTYDDNGNVIPLSERFVSGSNDIRYSYRGTNKDGIEVYETSQDVKNLTRKERQQQFLDIMANEYRGRTAKFIRNGHAYYATFDEKDVNKNIYGDKRSDKKGYRAKINTGADGDIFELVENAKYDGSEPERGKKITAHKGVWYWDYFIKTVQIDGTVFDLLANVRKKADGAFVYSIQLNENKKIKASPPLGLLSKASNGVTNASVTTVAQPVPKVNNKNSGTNSDRGDGTSNRDLLANAFEGITKSSPEYELIQEYKGRIRIINEYEEKLSKLNAEIRKLTFGTEGQRDTKRLKQLQAEAKKLAESINRNDKKLLSLEASEPLRKVIERERKKEAQKTKDHVKEIQQNKKVRAEQTELRHKIRKTIRDLNKILNRGNKQRNVKEDMQNVVAKALQAADILFTDNYGTYDMLRNGLGVDLSDSEEALVTTCTKMLKDLDKMPTDGYENWQARQDVENRLRTKMSKLSEVFARERKRLNNTKVSGILGELADAYKSLETSDLSYVQGAYSEPVHNFLKNLQSEVGGTIVKDMSKVQLENVYAAYKMVLTTVRKANQMFSDELKQSREQLGNAVIEEVLKAGGVHLLGTKMGDTISQFDWNNMKPIWVANRIGSDTFGKLMNGLFKGQYNFAVDIDEAKKFKLEMDKKYRPRDWDADKLYEFKSSTGKKFSLNLQQIMSLYAFSKREQAYSHLLNGGFVFEDNSTVVIDGKLGIRKTYIHKGVASYKMNVATLNGIINSLTAEQRAYVDEMQKYLSDVMGAKGNEVSMKLYGIQMFKEKFYFPLRSSGAYMERAKEAEMKKQQGQINLVNSGFTHAVMPKAKNPIILSGFMDVWAEHCNEMSMYHSMVLPMEDFRKVYNYSTIHDENMESASVYQTIQDAYGKAATNYIDQLYRELNAGATVDPRETPYKKLISNFKKAAVMLSGSVVVQQFSSIGRAYAVIDPKYFIGTKVNSDTHLSAVGEMKKYAPVAIIKEMGGFDTGTKGSAKAYIMAEQYGKGERLKALVKDEQYRGDIMGYMPAKADELTWCAIWEAVKRETRAKHPKMDVKSEEFLKLAGDRFSEVIEKTQVYDSVLARSANMRSKSGLMQMATAFMAEPTTTINLIEDAIRSGNAKNIARAFGSVAVTIVLNNALASVVYAMRDDDEDETFLEKYFQSFTSGMIDDINPMSYYPFLKDVYSLFQGYDVERADMSVIADVRDALKRVVGLLGKDTSEMDDDELAEHYKQLNEVFMGLLDAGCSAFGVPMKNVRRDAMGIINAWNTIGKDLSDERDNSWLSFWDKVGSAAKDTIPIYAWTKDKTKTDKLYGAIISGDKTYLARLKSTYKTDSAYQSTVRKALRENDSRIHDAAQARYEGRTEDYKRIFREIQKEGKFTFDDIMSAVNAEESKIRSGLEPEKATSSYTASDFVESIVLGDTKSAQAIKEDIIDAKVANGKAQEDAEKEFATSVATGIRDAYLSGLLDGAGAEKMLTEYADKDEDEAASKVNYWAFCEEHPEYDDLSESNVNDYIEFAEPVQIPLDVFEQFVEGTKDLETKKDEWGDVEETKREQMLAFIDSLDLTWEQKDALYLAAGYSESKIWDVPW